MLCQLVIRRGQSRVFLSVLGKINAALGMLNPHAHGKRLGLHGHALVLQHLEGIPGAVANGQHGAVAGNHRSVCQLHAGELVVFHLQAGDLGPEPDFASQLLNPLPQVLHHCQQHVGAHMGLGIVEDVFSGTGFYKLLQNPSDSGVIYTGVQLTVGKGSGAAFAKLDIAPGVQLSRFKEMFHRLVPGKGILSPFQHQRLPPCQTENQGGKHPRRAETDDHRPFFRRGRGFGRCVVGNWRKACFLAAGLAEDFLLVSFHRHVNGIDDFYLRLLPGVHAAADNPKLPDFGIGNVQHLGCFKLELVGIVLRG